MKKFTEKVFASLQSWGFALQLTSCPHELRHLVSLYRWFFACSFSGVIFTFDDPNNGKKEKTSLSFLQLFLSLSYLFVNATMMLFFLAPFTVIPMYVTPSKLDEPMKLSDAFNMARYNTEFEEEDIKPTLRLIMKSIFYLFVIEMIVNHGCNLLYGGQLVVELAELKNALPEDKQKSHSAQWAIHKVVSGKLVVAGGLTSVSLLLFNRHRLALAFRYLVRTQKNEILTLKQSNELFKMWTLTAYHFSDYVVHLLWPLLFLYTITLFKAHVAFLREKVETSKDGLAENRLEELTEELSSLATHFRRLLTYFSVPLTSILIINIIATIGSACFMSLNGGSSGGAGEQYYVSTIFSFGAYALIRMILIAWTSSLLDIEVRELIRVVHQATPTEAHSLWTDNGWLVFGQLRKLRTLFTVSFLDECFTLRQSTVLAMLGFALNYIVVLLQTENYQAPLAGARKNETVA